MKKFLPLTVLLIFFMLQACAPSETQIAATIAETDSASPQDTSAPSPTDIPTEIPTDTPSPTSDLRVINTEPRLIILTLEEIAPIEEYGMYGSVPNYKLYGNIINPYANLACNLGADAAAEFLDKTGLVTGWTTQYILADMDKNMPSHIEFTTMVFQSVEGPDLLFEEWGRPCEYHFYEYVEDLDFGEKATLCMNRIWQESSQSDLILYRFAIKYRNIYLGMQAQGLEGTFELEEVYRLVDLQMEKLAGLALEEAVTLTQDFGIGVGCTAPPPSDVFKKGSDPTDKANAGWCIAKRENGVKVCWGICMPECSGVTPEGEIVGDAGCIPCELLSESEKITPPIWGN